jgi:hypothetical protein
MKNGERILGGARLLVSNEAIHPGIRYLDGYLVRTGFQCRSDIDAIGNMPNHAQRLAVDGHIGQILYVP